MNHIAFFSHHSSSVGPWLLTGVGGGIWARLSSWKRSAVKSPGRVFNGSAAGSQLLREERANQHAIQPVMMWPYN